ncbi:MAG: YggS family pyridoxal phosphate-dependent enzyme [Bacteroidota bacterium]
MIAANLENVKKRVRDACLRAGRRPEEVRIVAVSKAFPVEGIREAVGAGQADFGENYAQEFRSKAEAMKGRDVRWHFIGHLQSNKVKYVIDDLYLLHSLDRMSLADELQKRAASVGRTVDALIEVHTTDEATKSGILPDDVLNFARALSAHDRIRVQGLMTMGPFSDEPERARPCFRRVRELQAVLRREGPDHMSWNELSMGMSGDFPVAIEEGATIVRIGTAIFGSRTATTEPR